MTVDWVWSMHTWYGCGDVELIYHDISCEVRWIYHDISCERKYMYGGYITIYHVEQIFNVERMYHDISRGVDISGCLVVTVMMIYRI